MNIPDIQSYAPPEWDQILTAAMKNDSLGIRRLVEEEGVSPSHANQVAQSALHIAALWGNVEAVKELLKHKADVNAPNKLTGATPLHCATQSMKGVKERRVECMELLVEHGADVSIVDFFGKVAAEHCDQDPDIAQKLQPKHPPLFQAIDEGKVEKVQELLLGATRNDGKPPYEEQFLGETPFEHALNLLLAEEEEGESKPTDRSNLVVILKALLEAGASVSAGGAKTNQPMQAFPSNPMQALENPVLPPLYRVCAAIQNAYKNKQDAALLEETCRLLLERNAPVTSELEQLLHTACRKNELQFAKLLTRVVKIDPNVKGRQGMTPLQFAARSGKTEMVEYLLSLSDIDTSIPDDRGQTALDAAKVNNKEDVVALLEAFAKK